MWGWLTAIVKGLGEALAGLIREWQRDRLIRREAQAQGAAADAERKAAENEQVAEVERRDLPGGVAGPRVRDVHKPFNG